MSDIILTGEYTANTGYDYKVEVIDTAATSPTSETFTIRNVTIDYHPDTDNILSPIIPSTAEIVCFNQGGYFNSTFLPDLIVNQQNKYIVKIYQDTGSGYSLFWFGWVLQDQVEEIEESQPREFVLKCADGLGRLQDNYFIDDNYATSIPQRTDFVRLILKAINYSGLSIIFGTTDDYLVTSCDWWEDTMTYGATTDPLANSFLDINIFRVKGEDGSETKYRTAYDVLREIATVWNCTVKQVDGLWRFEQVGQRVGTTLKENVYRSNGVQNSATSSASYEYAVATNTSLLSARAAGNNETFLPAAKYVNLNYEQTFLTDKLGQYKFDTNTNTAITIGTLEGLSGIGLSIGLNYYVYADGVAVGDILRKHKATFFIALTLENTAGTTYYYRNDNGGEWTTTSSTFEFNTAEYKPYTEATFIGLGNFNLITQPLPANGEVVLRVYLDDFYDYSHKDGWVSTALSNEFWQVYANVEIDGENQDVTGAVYSSVNNNSAIGDANTIDLGTVSIGDSLFSTGRIMVDNGGTYQKTNNWREGNSGAYTSILQLLCNETLAYFNEPIEVYDGSIYHSKSYNYRLNWDSQYYLPMDCSFDTNSGIWSGRWFVINRDKTNIAAETKYEKRKRIFRRIKANTNESDLPNGRIGGIDFDEDSGQFDGLQEYQITSSNISSGITAATVVTNKGSGTYIVPTKVLLIKTSGSTPYGIASASVYFATETTTVIDSAQFLDALNNGYSKQFNITDSIKIWEAGDLLIDIAANSDGDYEYTLKVYFKVIS